LLVASDVGKDEGKGAEREREGGEGERREVSVKSLGSVIGKR
jgi:hypothetical protein